MLFENWIQGRRHETNGRGGGWTWTITPVFRCGFLQFVYQWKHDRILHDILTWSWWRLKCIVIQYLLYQVALCVILITSGASSRLRRSRNLLDVVIASRTTRRRQQLVVQRTHGVSDHDLVTWLFSVKCRPPRQFLTYHFHSLKRFDVLQFQNDVKQSKRFLKPATTTAAFAEQVNIVTAGILNKYCPLPTRQKIALIRQVDWWISGRAIEAKRVRRRLERKWKSKGNRNDYVEYRRAWRVANKGITKAISDLYNDRIKCWWAPAISLDGWSSQAMST